MNLRALRETANLTQEVLASRAGMRQSAISALENGKVPNPTIDTVQALAQALSKTTDEIIDAVRASASEAA